MEALLKKHGGNIMRINHNIASLNTYRQLTGNTNATSKSLEKLSSGLRINRAGDDAAGLAISEKMRGQIRGLDQASRNAQDGISLIQTAEGALNETHSILQRMRELAVQAATDTNTASDREEIQKEVDQLATEITRIANDTEFNKQKLLNGGVTASGLGVNTFHIGANAGQSMDISIKAMDAESLGVARDATGATVATGATAISAATVSGTTGSEIVSGAAITISVADNTGNAAEGTLAVGGDDLTITSTAAVGAAGNINFATSVGGVATVSASFSGGTLTIAMGTTQTNNTAANIEAAIQGLGTVDGVDFSGFTVSGTGDFATATGVAAAAVTGGALTGGADANAAETIVTFSDGGTNSVDVIVADTATEVAGTGDFAGLSFTTSDVTTADGTINLVTVEAAAATFSGGVKTADAVTSAGINVSTKTAANTAITSIEAAITTVSAERSKLGAVQNRLEHTINNLSTSSENLTASESRIRDVDMANEMMAYTKNNILTQAATAMLAQANQQPQGVLQLLQ